MAKKKKKNAKKLVLGVLVAYVAIMAHIWVCPIISPAIF